MWKWFYISTCLYYLAPISPNTYLLVFRLHQLHLTSMSLKQIRGQRPNTKKGIRVLPWPNHSPDLRPVGSSPHSFPLSVRSIISSQLCHGLPSGLQQKPFIPAYFSYLPASVTNSTHLIPLHLITLIFCEVHMLQRYPLFVFSFASSLLGPFASSALVPTHPQITSMFLVQHDKFKFHISIKHASNLISS
jgi:hypothetical protein